MITWAFAYMIVHGVPFGSMALAFAMLEDLLIMAFIAEGIGNIGRKK